MAVAPPQVDINADSVRANVRYPAMASSGMASAATAASQPAAFVLSADATVPNIVGQVEWSLTGAAAAGGALLSVAGGTVGTAKQWYVCGSGPGVMPFDPPLVFNTNEAVTITLASPGAGVTGTVSCCAWKMK